MPLRPVVRDDTHAPATTNAANEDFMGVVAPMILFAAGYGT
jgi:hypothetical protein